MNDNDDDNLSVHKIQIRNTFIKALRTFRIVKKKLFYLHTEKITLVNISSAHFSLHRFYITHEPIIFLGTISNRLTKMKIQDYWNYIITSTHDFVIATWWLLFSYGLIFDTAVNFSMFFLSHDEFYINKHEKDSERNELVCINSHSY